MGDGELDFPLRDFILFTKACRKIRLATSARVSEQNEIRSGEIKLAVAHDPRRGAACLRRQALLRLISASRSN